MQTRERLKHFSSSVQQTDFPIVLLLIFWYCHKRGREVRIEKENELAEQEVARLDTEYRAEHPGELRATLTEPDSDAKNIEAGAEESKDDLNIQEAGEEPSVDEKPETGVKLPITVDASKP